jgi:hypothetical protein
VFGEANKGLAKQKGHPMKVVSLTRWSKAASLAWLLLLGGGAVATQAGDSDMGNNTLPTTQQNNPSDEAKNKPKESGHDDDLVITPGGPVRKDNVHPVGPNEAVRREKDGTLVVVPRGPTTDQK